MGQKITIKAIFNSTKDNWESFGNNRYLLKLSFPEDLNVKSIITDKISRNLGVPPSKITSLGQDVRKNWIFEIL